MSISLIGKKNKVQNVDIHRTEQSIECQHP